MLIDIFSHSTFVVDLGLSQEFIIMKKHVLPYMNMQEKKTKRRDLEDCVNKAYHTDFSQKTSTLHRK